MEKLSLIPVGDDLAICLPAELLERLGWTLDDELDLVESSRGLLLTATPKPVEAGSQNKK